MEDMDEIAFCTLGMFIIDEIHYLPPKPPAKDIIGGAGSYAALGARIVAGTESSRSVGWVIDTGSDFPTEIRETVDKWSTSCIFHETPWRLTTRGWNGYDETEKRAFKYLTPKLRLDADSLAPSHLASRSFHLICSSDRCLSLVSELTVKAQSLGKPCPLFIWEPVPDMCKPEELNKCYEALKHVDIVSPNHSELAAFFGDDNTDQVTGEANRIKTEQLCQKWLSSGVGADDRGAVVVRAGKTGCFVANRKATKWIEAYHHADTEKVIDPTGGGNAFLGGFAIALVRQHCSLKMNDLLLASIWGSVAASFAIEQVGMPMLQATDKHELWNGASPQERFEELSVRM